MAASDNVSPVSLVYIDCAVQFRVNRICVSGGVTRVPNLPLSEAMYGAVYMSSLLYKTDYRLLAKTRRRIYLDSTTDGLPGL